MQRLDDLAVFVRVVEAGSFTAAARALATSQALTSKSVSRLEDRLGVRLLQRTTRRLGLTESGQLLFERARRALADLGEAEAAVSELQAEPRGTLKVSCPMSFGILRVAPVVPDFLARHPGVRVELVLDDQLVDLVEDGFDLAIRISRLADSSLVARPIAPYRQVVCASPAYLARAGEPRRPADLSAHNCVIYSYRDQPRLWHFVGAGGEPIAVAVSGNLEVNNGLAQVEAVLAGLGVTLIPSFYVEHHLADGRLKALLGDYCVRELAVHAVYPARQHLAPKVRAFVDFMAARLCAGRPEDGGGRSAKD